MPYIDKEKRPQMDYVVNEMCWRDVSPDGSLNYILFKYCKEYLEPSYDNYKNYIGELNECVAEIRRRLLAPYEDQKIKENGDVT